MVLLGAVFSARPLVAYTPPFSYNATSICSYDFSANGWFKALVNAYGSAARVYELIVPSTMVDSNGNLYCICIDDSDKYFGGGSYRVRKITSFNSSISEVEHWPETSLGSSSYLWKKNRTPTPNNANDATYEHFTRRSWEGLTPCVAREYNGASDYIYYLIYVLPSRWWNDFSGSDTEGLLLWKVRKSDGQIADFRYLSRFSCPELAMGYFPRSSKNNNKVAFSACHDVNGQKVYCQWLSSYPDPTWPDLYVRTRTITFDTHQNTWSSCSTLSMDNVDSDYRSFSLEPRMIKGVNNVYSLAVRNGYYPYIHKVNSTTNYWTVWGNGLHGSDLNTTDCSYHADFEIVKASDNTEIFLVLMYSYGNRCNEMNNENSGSQRWTTNYLSWGMSNIVLHVQSSTTGANWTSGPENVIYATTLTAGSASTAETLSTSTLYKCTHKLVAYNNHIIYAYCYPGRKTHLILGVARYFIDSNKRLHLSTKIDFADSNGNSFSSLADCSRIISMDVSANGHLWITWMSANNQTYYCFHTNAQDIIDQAI